MRWQTFRNPKEPLLSILKESGNVGETNGAAPASKPKRKQQSRNVDMEKLADALPQLGEDDLLQVVQMVHDNKTEETYTKNDLESELICSSNTSSGFCANFFIRRRVPRRPLHSTRQSHQDALGLHLDQGGHERRRLERG
jgi:hypothetical protein